MLVLKYLNLKIAAFIIGATALQACTADGPEVVTAPAVETMPQAESEAASDLNILAGLEQGKLKARIDPEGLLASVVDKGSLILSISEKVTESPVSVPKGNFSVTIPTTFESLTPGQVITFEALASSPQSAPLYVGYTTLGAGNSGWRVLELTSTPRVVKFEYFVKESAADKLGADLLVFTNRLPKSTIKLDKAVLKIRNEPTK